MKLTVLDIPARDLERKQDRLTRAIEAGTATFNWKEVNAHPRERGVTLISAGLDEVPMVYEDIHQVMAAQSDLVEVLDRFNPKLVKMAPSGERAED